MIGGDERESEWGGRCESSVQKLFDPKAKWGLEIVFNQQFSSLGRTSLTSKLPQAQGCGFGLGNSLYLTRNICKSRPFYGFGATGIWGVRASADAGHRRCLFPVYLYSRFLDYALVTPQFRVEKLGNDALPWHL